MPLDLETYVGIHFSKLADQTYAGIHGYITHGRSAGLPVDALEQLATFVEAA